MHDRTEHTIARLDRFLSERIEPALWRRRAPLTVTAWQVPDEPVPFIEAVGQPFQEFAIGQGWARPWGTTWFRVQGGVPAEWAEQSGTAVELLVDLGFSGSGPGFQAEATAYTPDGVILKGIEPRNHHVPTDARPGEPVDVFVEAAANPSFDDGGFRTPTPMGDKETAGRNPSTGCVRWRSRCGISRSPSCTPICSPCADSSTNCRRPARAGPRSSPVASG